MKKEMKQTEVRKKKYSKPRIIDEKEFNRVFLACGCKNNGCRKNPPQGLGFT